MIEAVNFVQAHLSPHCLQPLAPWISAWGRAVSTSTKPI